MRKLIASLICLSACAAIWLNADAQESSSGVIFFQHRHFNIPFRSDQKGINVTQVRLFVSSDQGRSWQYTSTAAPDAKQFRFDTPNDGYFWFAVQTIDNTGKAHPPTADQLTPNLKVVVDTVPPNIQVQALPSRVTEVGVAWTIKDDNLDLALPDAMRVEYRVGGGNWVPLQVNVGANQHYWNPNTNQQIEIRILARDRAGNVGEGKTTVALGGGNPNPIHQPIGADPNQGDLKHIQRRFINSKQISMTYDLKDVGPSGVSSIELWYSLFKGRAWNKLTEYPIEGKNPTEKRLSFEVNDEGIYGITLVAKSGVGLGDRPPHAGDAPQFWIEVDLTKPVVQILDVKVGQGIDKGNLTVVWNARDKNLGAAPIRLSYCEQKDGAWQSIADKLGNSGRHVWKMPDPHPYQFYVKVEAIDLAGNVGEAITFDRVKVDLSLPKAEPRDIEAGR